MSGPVAIIELLLALEGVSDELDGLLDGLLDDVLDEMLEATLELTLLAPVPKTAISQSE